MPRLAQGRHPCAVFRGSSVDQVEWPVTGRESGSTSVRDCFEYKSRMKFTWKWIAIPLLLGAFGAAAAPWTFSGEALRRELADQMMQTTGLRAIATGRATFAILPRPRIKLEKVSISDENGSLAVVTDFLKGDLRILPLIAGRMELASLLLVSPTITYDIDGQPLKQSGAIARASDTLPATPEAAGADEARLGVISISGGSARIMSKAQGFDTRVDDINLTLDWPRLSSPASLNGTITWAGEVAEVAAWLGKPAAVLRGEQSSMTMKIESPGLSLSTNGALSGSPRLQYEGRVAVATRSLRTLMRTVGVQVPLPGPLANVSLTGNARAGMRSIALSGLRMTVDGNSFEGTLALQGTNVRPTLSGTLASDLLILSPIVSDLPSLTGPEGQWSRAALDLKSLDFADVDLRFSAARARLGRTVFEDTGCSILLTNGRLDVTLGQARTSGGLIKGRASLTPGVAGVDLRASGVFTKIDSGALMKDALRGIRITGEASGQFSFDGQGETVAELIRSVDGRAQITFRNGDIMGLDLEQALRRLEKRPLSIVTEVRSGRTGFETAVVSARLNDGLIELDQAAVSGLGVQLAVTGQASLSDRNLQLRALARQTSGPTASARESGPQLLMEIRGSWDDPALIFDTDSLMRRSEAAAPLLRALEQVPAATAPAQAVP